MTPRSSNARWPRSGSARTRPGPVAVDDPADPRLAPYTAMRERDLVGRAGRFIVEGEVTLRVMLSTRARFGLESVLLAPERVLFPCPTSLTILERCDGARTLESIVSELAAEFEAPRDDIARDVDAMLGELAEKDFLQVDVGA